MAAILGQLKDFFVSLTTEQITLFSILVTIVIFLLGKHSEIRFKKLESRRTEYKKFIDILQKIYSGNFKADAKTKNEFFDTGVSLLIYGSKKVYKKYVFFREYTTNPLIQKSKYYTNEISIYIIADILKTIRHEVGMTNFGELEANEVVSFFINDIGMNPLSKTASYKAKYNLLMIKTELFMINRLQFAFSKKIIYFIIMPVFGFIKLSFKYLFLIPFGKLLVKVFPNLSKKMISQNNNEKPEPD